MAEPGLINIQPLNKMNYQTWSQEMKLRGKGLWRLVSEQEKKHASDPSKQDEWDDKSDKACWILTLRVEPTQPILQDVRDDPIKIWTMLEAAHVQKWPGTRFNAYDDFFSIRKNESQVATNFDIENLCPKNFDLKQSDEELVCMAMIQALPEEYTSFTSSVLLLGTLSKSMLQDVFYAEETNCRHCVMDTASITSEMVLFTKSKTCTGNTTKTCKCGPNIPCNFCERLGHYVQECYTMTQIKKQRKEWQATGHSNKPRTSKVRTKPWQTQLKTPHWAASHPRMDKMAKWNMETKQVLLLIQNQTAPLLTTAGMQTWEHPLIWLHTGDGYRTIELSVYLWS